MKHLNMATGAGGGQQRPPTEPAIAPTKQKTKPTKTEPTKKPTK